jgi:uncharacterized RDD family membrane protein YckC
MLRFPIATAASRLGAATLDVLIIGLCLVCVSVVMALAAATGSGWLTAAVVLALFAIQNGYFVWFELRGGGTTPGKRGVGIRVMDARGGPLRAEAVITRNLVRNLELWLPLQLLLWPTALFPEAPAWVSLVSIGWILLFGFFPLFNRQRRRLGDLIAGTIVVQNPRAFLLRDLGSTAASSPVGDTPAPEPEHVFRPEQLDIYGIYELQTLELVLRTRGPARRDVLAKVCHRVKRKIDWDPDRWNVDPERFLMDFYAAQRRRLEGRMLMGDRQEYKRVDPPPPVVD